MDSGSEIILEARNLVKSFQTRSAVDNISLRLRRGEIIALLGPNGAGKTTLVNVLLGRIPRDAGEILYRLHSVPQASLEASEYGYFPEDISVLSGFPLVRLLSHIGQRQGMSSSEINSATTYWLNRLNLADAADLSFATLSRGKQQKMNLARTVLHRPSLIFLDEPFAGLDPVNQELFVSLIRELRDEGATIILTDHQLALVERLADRYIFLNGGRIVADGTLEDLRERVETGTYIRLRLLDPGASIDISDLEQMPIVRSCKRTANGEIHLATYGGASTMEILNYARRNLMVSQIFSEVPSLHDIYLEMFARDTPIATHWEVSSNRPALAVG